LYLFYVRHMPFPAFRKARDVGTRLPSRGLKPVNIAA
jgi:hypothetical protein